jgi:hypothetical protein
MNGFKERRRLRWGLPGYQPTNCADASALATESPAAATAKPLTRREFQSRRLLDPSAGVKFFPCLGSISAQKRRLVWGVRRASAGDG